MTTARRRRRPAARPATLAATLLALGASAGCGPGAAAPDAHPGAPSVAAGASATGPAGPQLALAAVLRRPHLLFRSTDIEHEYGVVAAAPLDNPDGPRAYTGFVCDRVYAAAGSTICLATARGTDTTFTAALRGRRGRVEQRWALPGTPSRARVSASGRLVATTVFVAGDSYESRALSTRTEIRRVGGVGYGDLEKRFTLRIDGHLVHPEDENVWGVTFARDDRTFYATVGSGAKTWLVRGDLRSRTLTAVHGNAECPALSPDGTKVAYKKRIAPEPRPWAVAVLDLATGRETVLRATRGLDDQVEWLDEHHLLYGLPRAEQPGASDVWVVAAAAGARPSVLVHDAWSPAVED